MGTTNSFPSHKARSLRRALAIDIGGSTTKLGLVSPEGKITHSGAFPTRASGSDPEPFFTQLLPAVQERIVAAGHSLMGIGISTHGEVDHERRGPIISGNNPALRNVDIRGRLEAHFGLRVILNNDLVAHALGEYHYGCGLGVERFMCMAVGTGLGAAMVVQGQPLIIDGGNSGNTGLIILDPDMPRDSNGIAGSAEGLCGVPGIERLAYERYGRTVRASDVIAAAREGNDSVAQAIVAQVGSWLGQTLASLSVIFYPHRIALTGGTASAGSVLLNACRARFLHLVGPFFHDIALNSDGHFLDVEIVLGERGAEAALLGAVVELFQEHGLLQPRQADDDASSP
ncbi:MAG: ROK family protein [Anaerolineae bacterium]|nr:ROK family protein [Anaerolineae bacterium]